jgi:hypothetical protein
MPVEQKFDKFDESTDSETTARGRLQPFWPHMAKRLAKFSLNHADFFVMLLFLGFMVRYCLLMRPPIPIGSIDYFDTSAAVDMLAKAQKGIWLGRDVFFTYGPLFQKLLSWGPLKTGMSFGSFYIYLWIFHYSTIIVSVYLMGAFLLRSQPSWLRVFYLLLMIVFWMPINWILFGIKFLFPLCCFAIFLRMSPAAGAKLWSLGWRGITAAALIAIGFLISGDAGLYSAAALVIIACAILLYEHDRTVLATLAKYAAMTSISFTACVLIINTAVGSPLDFRFWRQTYEIVAQYRWSHAVGMAPEMTFIFWLAVSLNLAAFVWQWMVHLRIPQLPARAYAAWFAMLCFGLLMLQTILVSSEHFHAAASLFPWIALSAALLLGATEIKLSGWRFIASLSFILIVTGLLSGPYHLFTPQVLFEDRSGITSSHSCPEGTYEMDQACLEPTDFQRLKSVHNFLLQHTPASDFIGVFPYENVYGFASHRSVAGAVWQNYVIAGDYMIQRQIDSFEKARPSWVVYSPEPWLSYAVNGIPNFTRTPSVWLYWQRWYKHEFDVPGGPILLQRDEERGEHWNMTSTSVLARPVHNAQAGQEVALPVTSLGDDWDFIKITIQAKYPLRWKLLKPSIFVVWVHFDRGPDRSIPVIVQPDHPYEIWVYPGEQAGLVNYFSPKAGQWRDPSRPHVQGLSLQCVPLDWLSVMPSWITINDVQTVKLSEQ